MSKILTLFGSKISKNTAEGTVPSMKRASSASTKTLVLAGTTMMLFLLLLMPVGLLTVWAETFVGTNDDDSIDGTNEDDLIKGLGGDDELNGLDGNDQIKGGKGEDKIDGGEGDNSISGGKDDDEIVFELMVLISYLVIKETTSLTLALMKDVALEEIRYTVEKEMILIRNGDSRQLDLW